MWGSSVENPPPYPGSDRPHGPTKGRKLKNKQGERNWVGGGRGAEYESEDEERVRW